MLGTLSFSIFLNDIFCLSRNVNYVTLPMTTLSINQEKVAENWKRSGNGFHDFTQMVSWKSHGTIPGKFHYIVIGDDDPSHKINLNNNEIASSNEKKLLGIVLGRKLNFDSHITSVCKKAGEKRSALARINH